MKTIAILIGVISGITSIVIGILQLVAGNIATGIALLVSGIFMLALIGWIVELNSFSKEQQKKIDQLETLLYDTRKKVDSFTQKNKL